jgi:hypothetical protein
VTAGAHATRVQVDRRAAAAWGLPAWLFRPGTVLQAASGCLLRLRDDGGLEPVQPFGHRSIASDPAARALS